MRHYRNWQDLDWSKIVAESYSVADVCRKIGILPVGGNFRTVKIQIQKRELDTSHFTGQTWNKGKQLKNIKDYAKVESLKPHLITTRTHKCESCSLSEWLGQPISLEVHHLDGDSTHNIESNLQLLCPNCHSLTSNYRNRKRE